MNRRGLISGASAVAMMAAMRRGQAQTIGPGSVPSVSAATLAAQLANLAVIGGVQIGSAGRAGTPQSGYTMVWGDDFNEAAPNLMSPTNPTGKYAPWATWVCDEPYSNTATYQQIDTYLTNPNDTGWNDVNRGVSPLVWQDIITQANSLLSIKCRRYGAANEYLWTDSGEPMLGGGISAAPFMVVQPTCIFECRIRMSAVNANLANAGTHPSVWTVQSGPMSLGNNEEIDIPDSDGVQFVSRLIEWSEGAGVGSVTNSQIGSASTNGTFDGAWHTFLSVFSPTGVQFYCDGLLIGSVSHSLSTKGIRPSHLLYTNMTGAGAVYWGSALPNVSTMDLDWWRVWVPTGNVLRTPLVPPVISTSGCSLTASGDVTATLGVPFSIALPSAVSLWGSASVVETVEAMPTSIRAPGGMTTGMFAGALWPPGISYNASTFTLSGTVNDQPGELWVVRTGTLAGDGCLASRFRVCFAPRILTPANISMSTGTAFTYDLYRDADVGNLLPLSVTAAPLPTGLSLTSSGPTVGMITGTPSATSTTTITVTNCIGQSVTKSVTFGPVSSGSGVVCPALPNFSTLALAGLVGSLDFDNSASITLASGAFGAGGVISAVAAADGTAGAAVQGTSANRPTSVTINGHGAAQFVASSSQYLDWTAMVTAAGGAIVGDNYTLVVVGHTAAIGSNSCFLDIANGASSFNTDRATILGVSGTLGVELLTGSPQTAVFDVSAMVVNAPTMFVGRRQTGTSAPAYFNRNRYSYTNTKLGSAKTATVVNATVGALRFSGGFGNYLNGTVYRVLVFNRFLEPYEYNIIAAWAAANYRAS
jgi:hypothetical protein